MYIDSENVDILQNIQLSFSWSKVKLKAIKQKGIDMQEYLIWNFMYSFTK